MGESLRLRTYSYHFGEPVMNSKLALKEEIEGIVADPAIDVSALSRPAFREMLTAAFAAHGWTLQTRSSDDIDDPSALVGFIKDRAGVEIEFGHPYFIGMDLLKLQLASSPAQDRIDVGVYVVTTVAFQRHLEEVHGHKWRGSISFERVVRYLPHFRSAISVPIYVLGIDI